MTREEAISCIKHELLATVNRKDLTGEAIGEALDMAIEALSAEQKEEELAKDIARRMATIIENEQDMRVILKNASAEPTVIRCRTLLTDEDFKMVAKQIRETNQNVIVIPCEAEVVSTETSTETSTDLISRADAIEAVENLQTEQWIDSDIDYNNGLQSAIAEIKALPSADRPSGEWIIRENGNKECSLCGHERQDGWDYFCGYCGAKMGNGGLYYADNRLTVEWKLASEELPQKVGSYIVTCKDEYGQVYVDYDYWTVADEFKYNRAKVTAWIPFPKPYCGAKMGSDAR